MVKYTQIRNISDTLIYSVFCGESKNMLLLIWFRFISFDIKLNRLMRHHRFLSLFKKRVAYTEVNTAS